MKVFVIGASGWIGNAIVDQLLSSHHEVIGLVRADTAQKALEARGVRAYLGDLSNTSLISSIAEKADVIIFAASASLNTTLTALQTIRTTLFETNKLLIYISGSSLYGNITEQHEVNEAVFVERLGSPTMQPSPESLVYSARQHGVEGIIVVGAGLLYGRGSGATPTFLLNNARKHGVARYIEKGNQRWSAIHVDDLARLVVRIIEQKPKVAVFNAVATALPLLEVAEIVAEVTQLKGRVTSISRELALQEWGSFWATILAGNLWLSSAQATALGWQPTSPTFRDDLLYGSYRI